MTLEEEFKDQEKRNEDELKASFKANLKASLHQNQSSIISKKSGGGVGGLRLSQDERFLDMQDRLVVAEERLDQVNEIFEQTIEELKGTLHQLGIRNEYLESQLPHRIAEAKLKKENEEKEQLLKKKGGIL